MTDHYTLVYVGVSMLDNAWLSKVFQMEKLTESGHGAWAADRNLGLGHLYYGLVRAIRSKSVVVIGSWRGFVPIIMAKAMQDNTEGGEVTFIDPSLADGQWDHPEEVSTYFQGFGVAAHIRHFRMTTQEFVKTPEFAAMGNVGLLFIDGLHTAEQAAFDHEAFAQKLVVDAPVMFHDSRSRQVSKVYSEPYSHTVYQYIEKLRVSGYAVIEFGIGPGLALVQAKPFPPAVS